MPLRTILSAPDKARRLFVCGVVNLLFRALSYLKTKFKPYPITLYHWVVGWFTDKIADFLRNKQFFFLSALGDLHYFGASA